MQGIRAFDRKRTLIFIIVPVLLFALLLAADLITKYFARENEVNAVVIDNFFYLSFTLNSGAAFSFLANKEWGQTLFLILTPVALIAFSLFFVFAVKKGYKWLCYSLVLVIAGTVGNFIDRVASGKVVDFLSFKFGSYYFPTFNVADICLTVGVIMLIAHFCFFDANAIFKKKSAAANTDASVAGGEEDKTADGDNADDKR